MAATPNSIITPQTPRSACVIVNTAQATFPPTTTPDNTMLLVTAGANGARLTRLNALPHESTGGVGVLQLYRSNDGGTTKAFAAAVACANDTVSSSDAPNLLDFGYSDSNPLILSAAERLYIATSISKTFGFIAEWADY